jgi:copper chaperone
MAFDLPFLLCITYQVFEFNVVMTCSGCSGAVERVLGRMKDKGVSKVDINMDAQRVYVTTTLPSEEILAALKKTGRECSYIGVKSD